VTARSSSSDSRIGRASAVMVEPISRGRLLAAVSVAQLATGVAGLVVALRRRHPYDVFWMHGRPDTMARDAISRAPRCPRRCRTCWPRPP
jgi:hypothetical protein